MGVETCQLNEGDDTCRSSTIRPSSTCGAGLNYVPRRCAPMTAARRPRRSSSPRSSLPSLSPLGRSSCSRSLRRPTASRPMRRLEGDHGSVTTETVLLTPVLLFLVMIVIQFGLWYHAEHVAKAAAQEGV